MTTPPIASALGRLAFCILMCPALAHAQSANDQEATRFQYSIGVNRTPVSLFKGVLIQSRTEALIDFQVERGRWFAGLQNGLGYKLIDEDRFTLGVSANYLPGRRTSSDSRYAGLGDVPASASAFAFAEWRPVKDAVTVYGNIARAARSSSGMTGTLGSTLGFPIAGKWSGYVDLYLTAGNAAYNQTFYGVNAAQAASSGYAAFKAPSGIISTTPTVGLVYAVDPRWNVIAYAGRSRMSAGIGASPMLAGRTQPVAALLVNRGY